MKLRRHYFKRWLEAQSPDAIVGWSRNADNCPIANYLLSSLPDASVDVFHGDYSIRNANVEIVKPMPLWASSFVRVVDMKRRNSRVSARQALAILANQDADFDRAEAR